MTMVHQTGLKLKGYNPYTLSLFSIESQGTMPEVVISIKWVFVHQPLALYVLL